MNDKARPAKGETFDAWITKYALTQGVFVKRARVVAGISADMIESVGDQHRSLYFRPHWHQTQAEAAAQVRKMIATKRKTLAKQSARLDALDKDPLGTGAAK